MMEWGAVTCEQQRYMSHQQHLLATGSMVMPQQQYCGSTMEQRRGSIPAAYSTPAAATTAPCVAPARLHSVEQPCMLGAQQQLEVSHWNDDQLMSHISALHSYGFDDIIAEELPAFDSHPLDRATSGAASCSHVTAADGVAAGACSNLLLQPACAHTPAAEAIQNQYQGQQQHQQLLPHDVYSLAGMVQGFYASCSSTTYAAAVPAGTHAAAFGAGSRAGSPYVDCAAVAPAGTSTAAMTAAAAAAAGVPVAAVAGSAGALQLHNMLDDAGAGAIAQQCTNSKHTSLKAANAGQFDAAALAVAVSPTSSSDMTAGFSSGGFSSSRHQTGQAKRRRSDDLDEDYVVTNIGAVGSVAPGKARPKQQRISWHRHVQEMQNLEAKVTTLTARNEELQKRAKVLDETKTDLLTRLTSLTDKWRATVASNDKLQRQALTQEREIAALKTELAALHQQQGVAASPPAAAVATSTPAPEV